MKIIIDPLSGICAIVGYIFQFSVFSFCYKYRHIFHQIFQISQIHIPICPFCHIGIHYLIVQILYHEDYIGLIIHLDPVLIRGQLGNGIR